MVDSTRAIDERNESMRADSLARMEARLLARVEVVRGEGREAPELERLLAEVQRRLKIAERLEWWER